MPNVSEVVYCIDTSSLVNLRLWRPPKRYPDAWKNLDTLIKAQRLIAPDMVFHELDKALEKWARKRKVIFRRNSKELIRQAQEILARFPQLVDAEQPTSASADPFVIALAVLEARSLYRPEIVVVTEEKFAPGRPRIPHVCEAYQLKYLTIHQMFLFEKWSF